MDNSLTQIMPKQQRQHQQHRRCQLQRVPDTHNCDKRDHQDDAKHQPKHKVWASTISRHAPEYTQAPNALDPDQRRSPLTQEEVAKCSQLLENRSYRSV
jgi:hypothetical protein